MNRKNFVIILILAIVFAGCSEAILSENGDEVNPQNFEENVDDVDFCACLNSEDFGKTIPVINEWFSSSPDGHRLFDLRRWIKETKFCDIVDARIINMDRDTGMAEMAIMFEEDGMTKIFILEVLNSNHPSKSDIVKVEYTDQWGNNNTDNKIPDPLYQVESFYEYLYDCDLCSVVNIEDFKNIDIDAMIPIINKFLSGLPEKLTGEEKIKELDMWLGVQSCTRDAWIEHYSAIKTNPTTGVVIVQFDFAYQDNIIDNRLALDISWSEPMSVTRISKSWNWDNLPEYIDTEEPIKVSSSEIWKFDFGNSLFYEYFCDMLMINSNDELENYISTAECYPDIDIDFSKQTLLLVYGFNGRGSYYVDSVYLNKFSTGYVLNVDRYMMGVAADVWWQAAVVTDKVPEGSKIEILVNYVPHL